MKRILEITDSKTKQIVSWTVLDLLPGQEARLATCDDPETVYSKLQSAYFKALQDRVPIANPSLVVEIEL